MRRHLKPVINTDLIEQMVSKGSIALHSPCLFSERDAGVKKGSKETNNMRLLLTTVQII